MPLSNCPHTHYFLSTHVQQSHCPSVQTSLGPKCDSTSALSLTTARYSRAMVGSVREGNMGWRRNADASHTATEEAATPRTDTAAAASAATGPKHQEAASHTSRCPPSPLAPSSAESPPSLLKTKAEKPHQTVCKTSLSTAYAYVRLYMSYRCCRCSSGSPGHNSPVFTDNSCGSDKLFTSNGNGYGGGMHSLGVVGYDLEELSWPYAASIPQTGSGGGGREGYQEE